MKKQNNNSYVDAIYLLAGEAIVSLLIILVYIALGKFEWTVASGSFLGSIVTVCNFVILSYSVNQALNKFMDLRGDKELSEEEAEKFAKTNSIKVTTIFGTTRVDPPPHYRLLFLTILPPKAQNK